MMAKPAVEQGMAVDEYFQGQDLSRRLFDTISEMIQEIGPVEIRVTKSQVAFVQRKAFAWVWMPGKYLHRKVAPLVLTLVLDHRDGSSRGRKLSSLLRECLLTTWSYIQSMISMSKCAPGCWKPRTIELRRK